MIRINTGDWSSCELLTLAISTWNNHRGAERVFLHFVWVSQTVLQAFKLLESAFFIKSFLKMSRYDSDNNIPERNYMARFNSGDENATELVPMRPPAPQGYSGYQGYPGHSRGYPEYDRGSQPDTYARNGDAMYPPEQDTIQNPDPIQIILLMCRTVTEVTPREITTVVRSQLREGFRMEDIRSSQNWWLTTPRDTNTDRMCIQIMTLTGMKRWEVRDMTGTSMTETTEETGPRASGLTWAQLITPTSITTKMSRDLFRPKTIFPKCTSSF